MSEQATAQRVPGLPGNVTGILPGNAIETGNALPVSDEALLAMLNRAIDESGLSLKVVADALGVKPPKLTALRHGERPWTLQRIARLPNQVRVDFLRQWAEAEGLPASLARALRSLADAVDPQPRLPLIGEAAPRRQHGQTER